ncbi:patatin-like phospholipase family protein [Thiolapillus sp.]
MAIAGGCSSLGRIENEPVSTLPKGEQRYSMSHYTQDHPVGETLMFLAFSGGGSRAAALSYGVLEELRDTTYQVEGKELRLLDEVDRISSVSGGSFTSAYYGLFGERIFEDFKTTFLYKDVQGDLGSQLFGFFSLLRRIFTSVSRTEVAVNYYDKHIFQGKTFADIRNSKGPFILINASDLNSRSQFIFIQPQFDFLCSDISRFKVARAVAASSAVPVLFAPILVKRHEDCNFQKPAWLVDAERRAEENGDQRLLETVESLNFYLDKENPPYATLVDGGITDNLGLRTILRNVGLSGDVKKVYDHTFRKEKPRRLVVIVVDASTKGQTNIGRSRVLPSIGDTLTAVTDIQLHLYNTETNSLLRRKLREWAKTLSTPEQPITSYFIDLDVTGIKNEEERAYFNGIPTSFSLKKEQADKLIRTARTLLRENSVYQKLLHDLGAKAVAQY